MSEPQRIQRKQFGSVARWLIEKAPSLPASGQWAVHRPIPNREYAKSVYYAPTFDAAVAIFTELTAPCSHDSRTGYGPIHAGESHPRRWCCDQCDLLLDDRDE